MKPIRKLMCALALCGFAAAAAAAPADPKNGVEYLTLPQHQNTDSGKKVEVTEFFAYYCPHCNVLEPKLAAWVKKQGADIAFKRVHVPRDPNVLPQQRLFYTLEALGLVEQYHDKVFAAMHTERLRLNRDELVFDWAEKAGIERTRFIDTYRSFGVQAKVNRANAMMGAYHIDQWPMIAVDGRFLTSPVQASEGSQIPGEAEQQQAMLTVLDHLVAKAKAEKK